MDIPRKLGIPDHEFRLVFGRTKIEYDPNKEEINRKKHGYSLESAVDIFQHLLLPLGPPRPYLYKGSFMEKDEVRHNHMSVDDNGHVVFIVTTMRPDETVRVISFRRADDAEKKLFLDFWRNESGYLRPPNK